MPPMYQQSSLVFYANVDWPLIGIQKPVNFHEGIKYGSRSHSSAVHEGKEAAKQKEGDVDWSEDAFDVTPQR